MHSLPDSRLKEISTDSQDTDLLTRRCTEGDIESPLKTLWCDHGQKYDQGRTF